MFSFCYETNCVLYVGSFIPELDFITSRWTAWHQGDKSMTPESKRDHQVEAQQCSHFYQENQKKVAAVVGDVSTEISDEDLMEIPS
jgi:hypothetical protein